MLIVHQQHAVYATIRTFVEMCKFVPMTFSASDEGLKDHFGDECFTDEYFPYWKLFLGNVRCFEIFQGKTAAPWMEVHHGCDLL